MSSDGNTEDNLNLLKTKLVINLLAQDKAAWQCEKENQIICQMDLMGQF